MNKVPESSRANISSRRAERIGTRYGWQVWYIALDRVPPGVPEAFWRSMGPLKLLLRGTLILLALTLTVCIARTAVGLKGLGFLGPDFDIAAIGGIGAMYAIISGFGSRRAIKEYSRLGNRHDHKICLQCGYILEELPDRHQCPECGLEYDLPHTQETWRKWFSRYTSKENGEGNRETGDSHLFNE